MRQSIRETQFQFPSQTQFYRGKVRDVYTIADEFLVIVTSDRISAFDCILPESIPFKGQVLNQTAQYFFEAAKDIAPNHVISVPDPNVVIGRKCKAYPIELIVRGYLAGHAWRVYNSGERSLCGVVLPDGLRENDRLPEPIITPTTKSMIGHDEDISEIEILKSKLVDGDEWAEMKHYALSLFQLGSEMAKAQGLILVDTKYEMGHQDEKIYVIDEIHTPDSSRYFYLEGYEERQATGEAQKQLSKEFVRKWLMDNGFQGQDGQAMPHMDEVFVHEVSDRYIETYELITGKAFERANSSDLSQRIWENTLPEVERLLADL